jgi:hypothetical protein
MQLRGRVRLVEWRPYGVNWQEQKMSDDYVQTFGSSIEERIKSDLGATPCDDYPELADIKNLAGESMGHVNVYKADKLIKACCLSINVMPGARYFNFSIRPEPTYQIPAYDFEGMVTTKGSQVSMDIYPDMDLVMEIKEFLDICGAFTAIWDDAKASELNLQPSRLAHMRAFCSPYFFNSVSTTEEQLPLVEQYANRYFDEWLKIYAAPKELDAAAAAEKQRRHEHFSKCIVEMDPDRQMIVQVFGEEVTEQIENALMF